MRTKVARLFAPCIAQRAPHGIWGHQASVSGGHTIPVIEWEKSFCGLEEAPYGVEMSSNLEECPGFSQRLLGANHPPPRRAPMPVYSLPGLVSSLSVFILQVRNLGASPPWGMTLLSSLWSYIPFPSFPFRLGKVTHFLLGVQVLRLLFPISPHTFKAFSLRWFSFCVPPPRIVSLFPAASSDHAVGTPPSIY